MRHHAAWTLFALALVSSLGWLGSGLLGSPQTEPPKYWTGELQPDEHTAFLVGKTTDDEVLELTAALAATGQTGPLLFDSPGDARFSRAFFAADKTTGMIAVGLFAGDARDRQTRYGVPTTVTTRTAGALQKALFPEAETVVIAPANQRGLALQAACLAGALKAPLLLTNDPEPDPEEVKGKLAGWKTRQVYLAGNADTLQGKLGEMRTIALSDEKAVRAAHVKQLLKNGPIQAIVVANPSDINHDGCKMSTLAPWIALQKRAALVLTNTDGTDSEDAIKEALKIDGLGKVDVLIIAADLKAVPMPTRPNPIEGGKDIEIETEPMTPIGEKPCSFSVGRLFHEDRNVVALMLARQRLLAKEKAPQALIVSNPGGGLPLLETFSRNTANEFKNAGYDTTAYFGRNANKTDVKRRLPDANIFLWEGHYSTLVSSYAIHQWPEPLKPSLVFLQSCLALAEPKAQPFLERGAVAVIGSSTRTYSGSGGALALAFFDTLLYEDQSLGGSLKQAKNFMLAFAELKKRRFGEESKLGGANLRAAWAFTLWGDPTAKFPWPERSKSALPPVQHTVQGNTIIVTLPSEVHDKITSAHYVAVVPANGRLAGLVRKQDMADQNKLVPFTFAEVQLPAAKPGKTPTVHTKLPHTHWVFCYDERCQRGYLLVTPRASDHGELRFRLTWD